MPDGYWEVLGIIPAYAGSTTGKTRNQIIDRGSSPHTRGAPRRTACRTRCQWDHPRIRGEHVAVWRDLEVPLGIIPAYAGSTPTPPSGLQPVPLDHPRIRGEHARAPEPRGEHLGIIPAYAGSTIDVITKMAVSRGSSPHTRGAPSSCGSKPSPFRDHPRIRGESTRIFRTKRAPPSGSSPHTRGAQTRL